MKLAADLFFRGMFPPGTYFAMNFVERSETAL